MLTRTQKDDLRFITDCLAANGETASVAFVLALSDLSPFLEKLLPSTQAGRQAFLAIACRTLLEAVEGPGPARERLRALGRHCGPTLFTPHAFQTVTAALSRILSGHLGSAFSSGIQEACAASLAAAANFLQDGMSDEALAFGQERAV